MKTHVLDASDVARILATVGRDVVMDRMISRLERGLASAAEGGGHESVVRGGFHRGGPGPGLLEWMPHHEYERGATVKMVAYTPSNAERHGMPTVLGTVSRYDDATGRLVAVADAVVLTALRTGAASAVASRLLARPDAAVIGMIGAGAQAVSQLHALSRVFDVARVLVHDVDEDHAKTFADRTAWLGLDVRVTTAPGAAEDADIVCTATTTGVGHPPVLADKNLRDDLHVNAVGADLPGKTELPLELLRRALVCPDFPAQARAEGECQRLDEHEIGPELATLCAHPELGEAARDGVTVFDSTGLPLADHIALDVLLELAGDLGVGTHVQLEHHPDDVLDPYPGDLRQGARA